MENSKESSITVGTFVVPTVNPSFKVGKAIKSEFGSLAQNSHKSTVKGGDKAENLRIPQKTDHEWADNQFISIKPTGLVVTQLVSTMVRESLK